MSDEEKDYDEDQLERVIDALRNGSELGPEDMQFCNDVVREIEAKRRAEEEKGSKDAKAEGEAEGYAKGYAKGFEKGFEKGYREGYER